MDLLRYSDFFSSIVQTSFAICRLYNRTWRQVDPAVRSQTSRGFNRTSSKIFVSINIILL